MNRITLAIGGVAAGVALTFIAVALYFGSGAYAPDVGGEPSPTPSPIALRSGEEALRSREESELEPGTYVAELDGYHYTVRASGGMGWAAVGGSVPRFVWDGSGDVPNFAGLVFYGSSVRHVTTDACQWVGTAITPGPTADDFATALAALDGFESSEPTDVTVDGYHGKRLRLIVPDDVDYKDCQIGQYRSFEGKSSDYDSPGQTDDVWILDLNGTRHLFATHYQIGTPAETRSELERMVDSLQIEPVSD